MKFSIIGPAYPLRGGIAHHVYYLKRELTKRGHSVQVISFRKLYPKILFPGSSVFDLSHSKLDADAESILSTLNPLSWMTAFKAVKAFAPDVVIFQWWHTFFAPLVGKLARSLGANGFNCVLECHNIFPHERKPFDASLVRFATRPFGSFITHSENDRKDLQPFVGEKPIRVCPLPMPTEFASESTNERNGRTILFFGTVRKYKGLEVLLAALPKVLSETLCHLIVAGEFYEPEEKYRNIIRSLGLESHVTLENRYIANEEIAVYFDRADLLVLPYLTATQSAVAKLALANGLPVIASNTGGLSEVVIENSNGLLFPSGDIDALAQQIIHYFSSNLGPQFARNIAADSVAPAQCEVVDAIEMLAKENLSNDG